MRVAYDAQIFREQRFGGISRYFCELAPRISRSVGASALVIAPRYQNEYLRHVRSSVRFGWYSATTGQPGRWDQLAVSVAQKAAMLAYRPDILHETYFWGPLLQRAGTRRILTIYDMIHERYSAMFREGDGTRDAKRKAAQRADHIICISESTRRDVIELLGVEPSKLSVTYLAADLRPGAEAGDRPVQSPYILYVGERGRYKNFLRLVEALARSSAMAEIALVCCGGGAIKEDEWRSIDEAKLPRRRVHQFSAGDDELAAWYAGALCFVYPSLYEGFGIPPLEAMQCGCPVVCSRTSSIPEVAGEAAEYFDPNDAESIMHAIESVVTSGTRQRQLREHGRRHATSFSWDRCAAETLAIYQRVAGRGAV